MGLGGRRLVEYSAKPNKNVPQTLADLEKFANTLWRIYSALVEVGKVWWNLIPGPIIGKMDKVPKTPGGIKAGLEKYKAPIVPVGGSPRLFAKAYDQRYQHAAAHGSNGPDECGETRRSPSTAFRRDRRARSRGKCNAR
jgi:hypothetical protein